MSIPDAVAALERDLRAIFGDRMQSLVLYAASRPAGTPNATLAVVSSLTTGDLRDCAARVVAWQEAGLATPLILEAHEFGRSLDAFPYEFGAILADYQVIVRQRSVQRPAGRRVGPAAGVRGPGAQPPDAPA